MRLKQHKKFQTNTLTTLADKLRMVTSAMEKSTSPKLTTDQVISNVKTSNKDTNDKFVLIKNKIDLYKIKMNSFDRVLLAFETYIENIKLLLKKSKGAINDLSNKVTTEKYKLVTKNKILTMKINRIKKDYTIKKPYLTENFNTNSDQDCKLFIDSSDIDDSPSSSQISKWLCTSKTLGNGHNIGIALTSKVCNKNQYDVSILNNK